MSIPTLHFYLCRVAERLDKPLFFGQPSKERHFGAFERLVVTEIKARPGVAPHERLVRHLPPGRGAMA